MANIKKRIVFYKDTEVELLPGVRPTPSGKYAAVAKLGRTGYQHIGTFDDPRVANQAKIKAEKEKAKDRSILNKYKKYDKSGKNKSKKKVTHRISAEDYVSLKKDIVGISPQWRCLGCGKKFTCDVMPKPCPGCKSVADMEQL